VQSVSFEIPTKEKVSGKYIADKNDDCKFKQTGSILTNSRIQRQN
jgi:hypothetical protein